MKQLDPNLEQKFRNLSIESGDLTNEKVVAAGNARQKLDHEGNSIRIEKKLTQKRQYAQNPTTKDEKSKKKDLDN